MEQEDLTRAIIAAIEAYARAHPGTTDEQVEDARLEVAAIFGDRFESFLLGGSQDRESGIHGVKVALPHLEVGFSHADRFPVLQPRER